MNKELKAYLDNQFTYLDNQFKCIDGQFRKVHDQFEQIDKRFEQVENRLDTLESIQLRMENKFTDQLRIIFDKIVQIDEHMANQSIHVMQTI
ncbi:MAG: hypothetical protein HYY61_03480 [Deltaproteobacteria bacterium]|nr:hypothetical protein [Deltaproteobacteria bacterium]